MAFEINYLIGNIETYFRRDEMSVLFFYAKDLNLSLSKKMNYLLHKKITYMLHNNINTDGIGGFDDMPAHFNLTDMQAVIEFITNQLIPAMQNETVDMDGKYGGSVSNLINQVNSYNSGDLGFGLYIAHDWVPYEISYYIYMANEMKELLQESINLNTPMMVSYND
jgi:hypothetical protein